MINQYQLKQKTTLLKKSEELCTYPEQLAKLTDPQKVIPLFQEFLNNFLALEEMMPEDSRDDIAKQSNAGLCGLLFQATKCVVNRLKKTNPMLLYIANMLNDFSERLRAYRCTTIIWKHAAEFAYIFVCNTSDSNARDYLLQLTQPYIGQWQEFGNEDEQDLKKNAETYQNEITTEDIQYLNVYAAEFRLPLFPITMQNGVSTMVQEVPIVSDKKALRT
jgi:hypothetical protein